jgi:hypothetical protein
LEVPGLIGCTLYAIFEYGAGISRLIVSIIDVDQNLANNVCRGMAQATKDKHANGRYTANADAILNHALTLATSFTSHVNLL